MHRCPLNIREDACFHFHLSPFPRKGSFMPDDCIFCKIAAKQIPVEPVYEDEEFLAFRDLNPQAPVHVLLIPKAHFATILDVEDVSLMGRALQAVQQTAKALN